MMRCRPQSGRERCAFEGGRDIGSRPNRIARHVETGPVCDPSSGPSSLRAIRAVVVRFVGEIAHLPGDETSVNDRF